MSAPVRLRRLSIQTSVASGHSDYARKQATTSKISAFSHSTMLYRWRVTETVCMGARHMGTLTGSHPTP